MLPAEPTGWPASGTLELRHGSDRYRIPDLQSWLAARPDRAQPARYRFLQVADATDDPGVLSGSAGDFFGDQSQPACAAGGDYRRGRAARPARPCPLDPLRQEGTDLARRQYVLRQDPDVLARLHRLACQFPPARIRAAQGRRPV